MINKNKVVTINFTMKDETGEIIDSTQNDHPFTYISGTNQVLPKIEENVNVMIIGGKKTLILSPEEAYGEYKDEAVQSVSRAEFPEDLEIEEGMSFMADTPDGKHLPFTIKEIQEEAIVVDFNHPLAGKTLEFDLELVDIRDATLEELSHGHVHGPNGHHH